MVDIIVKGKTKPDEKVYFFRNKLNPGTNVKFFGGDAPRKCAGEKLEDTCPNKELKHGQKVKLTEEMAEHLKEKGIRKPVTETDEYGHRKPTGETYIVNRFELHEVR